MQKEHVNYNILNTSLFSPNGVVFTCVAQPNEWYNKDSTF